MTIGTITLLILGLAYLVWSYYTIKKLRYEDDNIDIYTIWWLAIHVLAFISVIVWGTCVVVLPYLEANWDKPLW